MLFLVIGLCAISVGITLSLVALFTGISSLILWSIVAFCYLAAGISFTIDVFAFNEPIGFNYFFPRSRLIHLTDFFLWLAFWPLLLPIQYVFGYPYCIMKAIRVNNKFILKDVKEKISLGISEEEIKKEYAHSGLREDFIVDMIQRAKR